jgi:hypothetical protein
MLMVIIKATRALPIGDCTERKERIFQNLFKIFIDYINILASTLSNVRMLLQNSISNKKKTIFKKLQDKSHQI